VWQAKRVWRVIFTFCIRERIQVVHFHGHNYATHLTPVLRLLGIRCFQHMTQKGFDDPATLLDGRGSRLQRYALSRLSAWIVQNPDDVVAHTRPPVINIPNAVAPPRPRLETPGKRTLILSGVVCPRKGQLEVLRLFAALPAAVRAGLRLRLAGSYTDDFWEFDADYVAQCRSLAATLPEAALLGHLSKQELTDELRQAHYFFAISAVEGLSNAYLECLNQGLLPITYTDRHDPLFNTLAITDALIRAQALDMAGISYAEGWVTMTATTVKMFIDIFIGVWAFILAYIWCAKIDVKPGQKVNAAEIWHRFPKFVIGYVLTFVILVVMCWPSAKIMGPAEKNLAELKASITSIETKIKSTTDATVLASLKTEMDSAKGKQKAVNETMKEPKSFLSKAKASSNQGDVFRGLFFLLCFFTIGLVSNFKKLMEEGLGKLAAVYCISLFGFIIWVGLFISWLFFHGVKPPTI